MAILRRAEIELHRARFAAMIPLAMPRLFARLYRASFYAAMHERWLDTLPLAGKEHAVDIGCGPGGLTCALAIRGLEVTGIDRSKDMIEAAEKRRQKQEHKQAIHFVVGDATALPCADRSFDLALCSSLINIVDDPAAVLREMLRVLRPGGLLSVLVPDPSLTKAAAIAYGEAAELAADDTALLLLWAGAAPKVSLAKAQSWFQAQGLRHTRQDPVLDGLVHVTTCRSIPSIEACRALGVDNF